MWHCNWHHKHLYMSVYYSSIGTTTPYWVLWPAELTVEPSQQEGFYRVLLPAARQIPNLEEQWLERSNSRHKAPPASETTQANPVVEGGTMGEKWPRILPKVATSTSLLSSFTCRNFTTWDRWLYFPYKGRRTEDFFARKIRRLQPVLNPRSWVPKASTLPPDHRSRLITGYCNR